MLHINQYIHIVLKYSGNSLKATKCPSCGALGILVGTILPKSIAELIFICFSHNMLYWSCVSCFHFGSYLEWKIILCVHSFT